MSKKYKVFLFMIIYTTFILSSCSRESSFDFLEYTQYISNDEREVLESLRKEKLKINENEDGTWIVKNLRYETIPFDIAFAFEDQLMLYSVEYRGENTEEAQKAAFSMYSELVEKYGKPSYPEEYSENEWDMFWSEPGSRAGGTNEYGGYRMLDYRWESQYCEFWVRLYGDDGVDGLQITCKHYQKEAWEGMFGD